MGEAKAERIELRHRHLKIIIIIEDLFPTCSNRWVWSLMSIISALRRLRKGDLHKFKAIVDYILS